MILDDIITRKKEELFSLICSRPLSLVRELVAQQSAPRKLSQALLRDRGGQAAIIAEVKKASPSKGLIRADFDPVAIAQDYEASGAAAISVLTEMRFFLGNPDFLTAIKKEAAIPVLRKDFLFSPYQLYESRAMGADALLLIAAVLEQDQLREYLALTRELGMEALVEVHTRQELDRVLTAGAAVIGINNRDLNTFKTDITTTLDLVRYIPDDIIVVSESGIAGIEDIRALSKAGVDAFLVGETLMRHPSPGTKLAELMRL